MKWKVKFRNQEHTLTSVDALRAVSPTDDFKSRASLADYNAAFGDVLPHGAEAAPPPPPMDGLEAAPATPLPFNEQRIFENAGWWFVSPNDEVKEASTFREHLPNANAAREVFVTEAGEAMMATERATVQLPPDMTQEQVDQTLKEHKLEKLDQFTFAKNMFEVRIPPGRPLTDVIEELQNNPSFLSFEPNMLQAVKVRGDEPADVNFSNQWQHRNNGSANGVAGQDMKSIEAWKITKGEGVRIAVIDTGMQINHPDLEEGIVGGGFFTTTQDGGYTFVKLTQGMNNFPPSSHGTFCMGLAAARTNPNGDPEEGGCGTAPGADLFAIACADNLLTSQATLARAVQYAVDPSAYDGEASAEDGVHIISCSLDTNQPLSTVLEAAIKYANQQGRKRNGEALGVPIFWAVSNLTQPILNDPVCCLPEVIAVGRYTHRGLRDKGAFGQELAFLAPGRAVYSTRSGNQYGEGDGTSFATALAAGVGALVLAKNPGFTAAEVRNKLLQSCDSMNGANGFSILSGFGKLNAHKAVT